MGWGWKNLPRNKTDIKIKIVQRLLAMRKLVDERYMLDQNNFMEMIASTWGGNSPTLTVHHNDCVWFFGIVMIIDEN